MRTDLLKKLTLGLCAAFAVCATHDATAQLSVGPSGLAAQTFATQPPAAQWSTLNVQPNSGTAVATPAQMDATIQSNVASIITTALTSSPDNPPGNNGVAVWSSAGQYIQTRPTGNTMTLLMATLTNNSGSQLAGFVMDYDMTAIAGATENVPGLHVYYSMSGLANSWIKVTNGLSGDATSGHKTASLNVTNWPQGAKIYILWSDDNADGGTDGAFQIDNFAVTSVISPIPFITSQPQSISVAPSTPASFTVAVRGSTPLTYYWRKNGAVVAVTNSATYTIASAQPGDSGTYSVIVSNSFGTATSAGATLTVSCATPVSLTSQPTARTLTAGATLTLTSSASGTTPITFQWYRNGNALPGATNATYTKANVASADSGLYYVVASNCGGDQSSEQVVVSVADAPFVVLPLTNATWKYDQSGANLGTDWRSTNYNDTTWASGRGLFAWENQTIINPLTNTVLSLSNGTTRVRTYYFRTSFQFTNDPALVNIIASNYVDDGAVFYLNGAEIYRINMSSGTVNFDTLAPAAGPATEGTFQTTNIPSSKLVQGVNYLAVEVHQNSDTSSDIAFGLALHVAPIAPTQLVITNQPQSITVEETKPATFEVGLSGSPAYYQWYRNGVAISNGTVNPYTIAISSTNDAGNYMVVATNLINAVTSSVAVLTVLPDTNAPALVDADGTVSSTSILVSFSELIRINEATNRNNYRVTNTLTGATLTISSAVLTNGTNVLLTTSARDSSANYILVVNNVRDVSPRQNVIAANSSIPVSTLVPVISLTGSAFRFHDPVYPMFGDVPDQGTAWRSNSFVEGAEWADGLTPFFYAIDTQGYETPFPRDNYTPLNQSEYYTTYFRSRFNANVSPGGARLFLRHFVDDGVIFYLNGAEVHRYNMPTGPIGYTNRSDTQRTEGILVDPVELNSSLFVWGTNLLAAELHQWNGVSDVDKVFTAELSIRAQSLIVGPVIVTGGPYDQTVTEGQPVTFSVVQAGGRTFQWQLNSNNITGGTNATFTTNATLSLNNAKFRVLVSNSSNSITTTNATLRVVADTNGPAVLAATLTTSNTIIVSFSEPVTSASANLTSNYQVTNRLGQVQAISSAALQSGGREVVLSFGSLPVATYFVRVSNIRDTSVAANLISPNPTLVQAGFEAVAVAMGGSWRYDESNVDPGASWKTRTFDDSSWAIGNALFEGKAGTVPALPEPVRTTLNLSNNNVGTPTFYFRAPFSAPGAATATLTFRTILDDGAVIYVNGIEVQRVRMPGGTITHNTLATSPAVGDATIEGPYTAVLTNLVDGNNVVAVEVHNQSLTSSDITWAGQFQISVPSIILTNPPAPTCTNIVWTAPTLRYTKISSNVLQLSWQNPTTNSCGSNAVFTLQRALALSNAPSATVWSNVTTISPTNVYTTNAQQQFFRLRQ